MKFLKVDQLNIYALTYFLFSEPEQLVLEVFQ